MRYFSSQKVDENMIFTDYWKVLVLNFLEMGNTVFFWAKKMMERWYLLIFWAFWWWEIRFSSSQKVYGKIIFTWSFEFSMIFQELWKMVFRAVDCGCFLKYTKVKDELVVYKCICCNKNYQKNFNENLKKRFTNTSKFSNHDINDFILLLWKDAYPYEYIDDFEKLNETSLPEKEAFLQTHKHRRYYWCRLGARKKSL